MTALDETTGNFAHERDTASLVLHRLYCSFQVKMESQRIADAHVKNGRTLSALIIAILPESSLPECILFNRWRSPFPAFQRPPPSFKISTYLYMGTS